MKAAFTRFGPKHNYMHAHVTLDYKGQILLGMIKEIKRHPLTNSITCEVRHLCGDPWPIEPLLAVLNILEREYEVSPE